MSFDNRSHREQDQPVNLIPENGHNVPGAATPTPADAPAAQETAAEATKATPAEPAEAAQSEQSDSLANLSVGQRSFLECLRLELAKYHLALTIGPDGQMFAQNSDGQSHSWGNIWSEDDIRRLFGWYIFRGISKETRLCGMVEMFPENTKLKSEFEEARKEAEARRLSLKAKKRARKSARAAASMREVCPAEAEREPTTDAEPLPGFSAQETKAFRRRQEEFAKRKIECYLAPDGTVYTLNYFGYVQPWMGNIRDKVYVAEILGEAAGEADETVSTEPNQVRASANSEMRRLTDVAVPPSPRRPSQFDTALRAPALSVRDLDTEFITGSAGTGKTYEIQRRKAENPNGVVLAATTGVAAVNLGPEVKTIHSLLKFFRFNSLLDAYNTGRLQREIRSLVDRGMSELMIDEISTFSAAHLDVLHNAVREVAREGPPIKLTIAGDFVQLPPIPDPESPGTERYAFEADCWRPNFSEHITRLTRIWRQENEDFVRALQAARRGAGEEALAHLQASGVRFEPRLDDAFEGTTLFAENFDVDGYNERRLRQAPGDNAAGVAIEPTRWSVDPDHLSEWSSIPERLVFKPGAYMMILCNGPSLTWANGDCGTVVGTEGDQVVVRLRRNGSELRIGKITRERTTRTRPPIRQADMVVVKDEAEYADLVRTNGGLPPRKVVMICEPHPTWITGWIHYHPLRLAYATTVHKSQGLSLDSVQIDLRRDFLGSPAMMYVALSRCRTPEGLVLVGTSEQLVAKTNIDPRVREWL